MVIYESSNKKQIIFIFIVFGVLLLTFIFGYVYDALSNNKKDEDVPKLVDTGLDLPNNINEIEGDYVVIDCNEIEITNVTDDLNDDNLSKYSAKFIDVINAISVVDKNFDSKDYKVYYQNNDQDKVAYLEFIYYIEDEIETNKIYSISIQNSNVTSIVLSGIKKENINNLANVDLNVLNQKINDFKKNKEEILLAKVPTMFISSNILDNKGNIKKESINKKYNNIKEKYYYDYNMNKLLYRLRFAINSEKMATLGDATEIEL